MLVLSIQRKLKMKFDIKRIEKAIKEILKTEVYNSHTGQVNRHTCACTTLRAKTWSTETNELKLFVKYFKPVYKGAGQSWFGSTSLQENQIDRHTALLFLLEITKDLNQGGIKCQNIEFI